MKLMKLFKKARLGKRRKGEVSDVDAEASVSHQRPAATSVPTASSTSPAPRSPHSAAAPARRHSIQRQTVAAQPARPSAASRVVPPQPSTQLPRSRSVAPQKTPAPNPPAKPHPKKPAVFHDIMPPRGVQRSRSTSFTKPSVKPQPPKHALSPPHTPLNKPTAALRTDKPITKRPLSSQSHQLPTQPKLPPQPKELTHPQVTAHSRAHIAVPSRRHPQLAHRPPHIRAMDMVHR